MVIKFLLGQGIYVTKPLLFFQKGSGTRLASKPLIAPTLFDHAHSFRFELHNIFMCIFMSNYVRVHCSYTLERCFCVCLDMMHPYTLAN